MIGGGGGTLPNLTFSLVNILTYSMGADGYVLLSCGWSFSWPGSPTPPPIIAIMASLYVVTMGVSNRHYAKLYCRFSLFFAFWIHGFFCGDVDLKFFCFFVYDKNKNIHLKSLLMWSSDNNTQTNKQKKRD